MIDGDRGGDDSVDPTGVGSEAHGESEGVYSKGGVLHVENDGL